MEDLNLSRRTAAVAILWPRLYHSMRPQQVELQKEVTVKLLKPSTARVCYSQPRESF